LCGDPGDRGRYTVAVLLVEDGRGGSREIHESELVGQQVLVRGPRNHFELRDAQQYLFVAGGIGITPIVAMVTRAQSEGKTWRLIYGGRSRASMAFWDRLAGLAPDRVDFVPQDTMGLPDLETAIGDALPGTAVYACGPAGMLEAVEALAGKYTDRVTLQTERFTAGDAAAPQPGDTEFEIELAQTGTVLTVAADKTILETVLEVVADHPYSCTEGVCGTCETTVLEGIPDHRDQVLNDFERSTNETMMICCGRSLTKRLVLDL
jgi:ferredoxin-NADP reductase